MALSRTMVSTLLIIISCLMEATLSQNPDPVMCGGATVTGNFNNQAIKFEVKMPFYGNMFFSINYNGFTLSNIRAYNKRNPNQLLARTASGGINYIFVSSQHVNTDIIFEVDGSGQGTYSMFTHCDATPIPPGIVPPPPSPTMSPTPRPSASPTTPFPTRNPTLRPSVNPTFNPTISPTLQPTLNPTDEPRTTFDIRMPYDGDLTLTVNSPQEHLITSIIAYDLGNPLSPFLFQSYGNTITILGLSEDMVITFSVEGIPKHAYIKRKISIEDLPTLSPTTDPTDAPTINPTISPTKNPSVSPTDHPSVNPTISPTDYPSVSPTLKPTGYPTLPPTNHPSVPPTISPTNYPSLPPTLRPSVNPTVSPTNHPSVSPTPRPTSNPSISPTNYPSTSPTLRPTTPPTTAFPTLNPTPRPTGLPTTPPLMQCGVVQQGEFNGEQLIFGLGVPAGAPYLTFTMTGTTPLSIRAYSMHAAKYLATTMTSNSLMVTDAPASTYLAFMVDAGPIKSNFNAILDCTGVTQCGTTINDEWTGPNRPRTFRIKSTMDGDMTIYVTGISVTNIKAYSTSGPAIPIAETPIAGVGGLSVSRVRLNEEIFFKVQGTGYGSFNVVTNCQPAAPTKNPTPAPTEPITYTPMSCNVPVSGNYDGREVRFTINTPPNYNADITFYITGFPINSIRAYNAANPTVLVTQTTATGLNSLTVTGLSRGAGVSFEVEGTHQTATLQSWQAISYCIPTGV